MRFRKSQPRSRSTAEPADHDHEVHDHDALGGGATLSRRGMLVGAGTLSLAGVLAACGDDPSSSDTARTSGDPNAPRTASTAPSSALPAGDAQILDELLAQAPQCPMTSEETEGPYWFDVDYIRSDIREDRQGVPLELALRVVDLDDCQVDGDPAPIRDAVVEIWHCDAAGIYSGFEKASSLPDGGLGGGPGGGGPRGGPGQGGPGAGGPGGERPTGLPDGPPPSGFPGEMPDMPGAGAGESDGSYSAGERQSERTDTEIYLRGAQSTDKNGVVRFTSIFPGWYTSRTVHIHLRVHIDRKTVRTSQLYFDDALTDAIHAGNSPYDEHPGRDTRNDTDHIYDATGLLQGKQQDETVFAALNLGVTKGSKGGA